MRKSGIRPSTTLSAIKRDIIESTLNSQKYSRTARAKIFNLCQRLVIGPADMYRLAVAAGYFVTGTAPANVK